MHNSVFFTRNRGLILEIVDRQQFLGVILERLNVPSAKLVSFSMYRIADLPHYCTAGVFLDAMTSSEAETHFVGAISRAPIICTSLTPKKPLQVEIVEAVADDEKEGAREGKEALKVLLAKINHQLLIDVVPLLFHERLNGLCILKGCANGTFELHLYMTGTTKGKAKYFGDYPELQRWLEHSAELDRFYQAVRIINES